MSIEEQENKLETKSSTMEVVQASPSSEVKQLKKEEKEEEEEIPVTTNNNIKVGDKRKEINDDDNDKDSSSSSLNSQNPPEKKQVLEKDHQLNNSETTTTTNDDDDDIKSRFSDGLFEPNTRDLLRKSIEESGPYKHGVIPKLMNDSLLRQVRQEIIDNLHFTKKETDIYKVFQTGDLRNLSGLGAEELARLPSLHKLRDALYSKPFREHLAYVAKSGPLSGSKQDLSINVYQQGCHLLNHDDVIGSRRISYILYLPDPDEHWEYPKNGGALRLYPTQRPNVPAPDWTLVIPPAWNQLAFFTVQPGLSFHDVEEVFVSKPRMSISGWFHIPQAGEDGYIEGELERIQAKSSLRQLESNDLREFDFPKQIDIPVSLQEQAAGSVLISELDAIDEANGITYDINTNGISTNAGVSYPATVPESRSDFELNGKSGLSSLSSVSISNPLLSSEDTEYLSKFLRPSLLDRRKLGRISRQFLESSMLEIKDFLNPACASKLRHAIDAVDVDDVDNNEDDNEDDDKDIKDVIKVPQIAADIKSPWKLAGPPHKVRYMYMDGLADQASESIAEAEIEAEAETESKPEAEVKVDDNKEKESEKSTISKINKVDEESLYSNNNKTRENKCSQELLQIRKLFTSPAFRNWIRAITRLNPNTSRAIIRRFRPGLDYTLATGLTTKKEKKKDDNNKEEEKEEEEEEEETENILESTLNLTPSKGWQDGELGGYELYMAIEEEDTSAGGHDPAVYRGSHKKNDDNNNNNNNIDDGDTYEKKKKTGKNNNDNDEDEDEEDDSVLLTTQACWNKLTLVARDSGILKFVKYVSGNAPGSRWDVSAEWRLADNE